MNSFKIDFNWESINNWKTLNFIYNLITIEENANLPDWSSLSTFHRHSILVKKAIFSALLNNKKWNNIIPFYNSFIEISKKERNKYLSLITISDNNLKEYNGDPLNFSWNDDFRPLRLSREEDWSDWLAFFLKRSTGRFIYHLFGVQRTADKVHREYTAESSRADIVIEWDCTKCQGSHIEVKVGDPNLGKTHGTSLDVRCKLNKLTEWDDYIVLLDSQLDDWDSVDSLNPNNYVKIRPITWSTIAVAIRKCLYEAEEDLIWRSLAYVFTGCIETKLYQAVTINIIQQSEPIFSIYNQIEILERSLNNVKRNK